MTLALHGKSRQRQWLLVVIGIVAVLGAAMVAVAAQQLASAGAATLNPAHVGATNPGFSPGACPAVPEDADGPYGWHFIAKANANFTSLSVVFKDGADVQHVYTLADAVQHPDASHAYIFTPAGYTLFSGTAVTTGSHTTFNLSHVCAPGQEDPDPSVSVEKSHEDSGPFQLGDTFDWVITVTVSGDETTDDTEISDQVDDGLQILDITGDGMVNCGSNANIVTCTLPEGSAIDEYEMRITVFISENIDSCGVIPNEVTISGENVNDAEDTAEDSVTVLCEQNITATYQVCKVITDASAIGSGTFDIQVGAAAIQLTVDQQGDAGIECDEVRTVDVGTSVAVIENNLGTWNIPVYEGNGETIPQDDGISIIPGPNTCLWTEPEPTDVQVQPLEVDDSVDCLVIIYNTHPETTRVPIQICKVFLDNEDGTLTGATEFFFEQNEGALDSLTVPEDGSDCFYTYVEPGEPNTFSEVAGSIDDADGFPMVGFGDDIAGAFEGDSISVTVIEFDGFICGTTISIDVLDQRIESQENGLVDAVCTITFWNQEEPGETLGRGFLNVHKDTFRRHNGGPNIPQPNDDDGWTITVTSEDCDINISKQTDANGNAVFEDLPLCDDYVVSENPVNPSSPGYSPQGATSVDDVTPSGQTITFTNAIITFDPGCTNINQCGPVILVEPTPTNTPVPPTETPVPPTATPTLEDDVEGEKTPGPATPIAPDTGSGSGGSMAAGMNMLLVIAGLLALGSGLTVAAAARRRG